MHKKILVLGPITPQKSDIAVVASSLSFLETQHEIHCLDPLSIHEDLDNAEYYDLWQQKLEHEAPYYDAFIGFSFGGVILQQCSALFNTLKKPMILFSTPTHADLLLRQRLQEVILLCEAGLLDEALFTLYSYVFAPNTTAAKRYHISDTSRACERLIFGLNRVISSNSTEIINTVPVDHLHLIGEHSQLVSINSVLPPLKGTLAVVPGASMRVLQDNLIFCQKLIMETLSHAA